MGRKNLLDKSFSQIESFFDNYHIHAFNFHGIREIIAEYRDDWQISINKSTKNIIDYLLKKQVLFSHSALTPSNEINQIYTWKFTDDYTVLSGVKTNSYFSYYSALFFNGLTLQIPKTHYLNYERSNNITRISNSVISQKAIDNSFSKPQRKSKNIYKFHDKRIIIINGKFTGKLGVTPIQTPGRAEGKLYCTDLARTLIDVSVRPVYSGGVFEVLEAYRRAKGKVNILLIKKYLDELNYIYPYEQVIGFYLEKAEYNKEDIEIFNTEKPFDFYLTYEMRNKVYDEKWKLYYPKGM